MSRPDERCGEERTPSLDDCRIVRHGLWVTFGSNRFEAEYWQESRDLVEYLRGLGKDVEYLVFPDEGHDVLKLPNRVRCYDAITSFFSEQLNAS